MKLSLFLERQNKLFWVLGGFGLILLLGIIDLLTGYQVSFSLFYLIPITLVAWYMGRQLGLVMSGVSAIVWFLADILSGNSYSFVWLYLWNTLARLGFYIIVTSLIALLRDSFKANQDLARTDYITGAVSNRFFYALAELELIRSQRYKHPFTLAYLDLDNFKAVNDRYGHLVGDKVLHAIVADVRKRLRKTDVLGRLGGDEFGLLLPETGQEAAQVVVKKIRDGILLSMQLRKLPVTVSLGVVTCQGVPKSAEILIKAADDLMYSIKNHGKDGIGYSAFGE
jgi:diguanylate cyclase (GGDEF)-like protein